MNQHGDDRDPRPVLHRMLWRPGALLAGLGAGIVLSLAALYVVTAPVWRETSAVRREADDLAAQNAKDREINLAYEQFAERRANVEAEFEAAAAEIPTEAELQAVLDTLGARTDIAGSRLLGFRPGRSTEITKAPDGAPSLYEQALALEVESTYLGTVAAIRAVNSSTRLVVLDRLTLTTGAAGALDARMSGRTFFKRFDETATPERPAPRETR